MPSGSENPGSQLSRSWGELTAAWLVHLYTASGALMGLLALNAAAMGRDQVAFAWMFAATFVDASDGLFARRARVKERLPQFDGARLDDIVDYLTFVAVPAFLLYRSGLLPDGWELVVSGSMLLSSAYGFSRHDAKTSDNFFTGFPSYWNIVALYLVAATMPPFANAAVVLALSALVFVPIGYVYPSRTPVLQPLTLALGLLWAGMVLLMIWQLPAVSRALVIASLFFPVYYTGLSLALHARRLPSRQG